MQTKLLFKLKRPARKQGGDRYECELNNNPNDVVVVYIPQSISRANGVPITDIEITFEPK